ncbi:MAG: SDR family NAD(P)-dependent oxidoreductase [Thermodesulfobacteriota bacterium]
MQQFLSGLLKKGVVVSSVNQQLEIDSFGAEIDDADIALLKKYKKQIVDFLSNKKVSIATYNQERLWFLDQLDDVARYNIPVAYSINGSFDLSVLERSLQAIVDRHESFRVGFRAIDGYPVQLIDPSLTFSVTHHDISSKSKGQQSLLLENIATAEIHSPFNLEKPPLLRVTVVKAGTDEYVLIINMHHIISDGWSVGVFVNELAASYNAAISGKAVNLPELQLQVSDYASWERHNVSEKSLEEQLSYWVENLKGYSGVLDMPTDYPRPERQSGQGKRAVFDVPGELVSKLKTVAVENSASMYMVVFSAIYVVLRRYSQQNDICIGTPVAKRDKVELENLIGFFSNTLPVRVNTPDNCTFNSLLASVKDSVLDAYGNQEVPFDQIVNKVLSSRDFSRNPIFQVMIAYQNISSSDFDLVANETESLSGKDYYKSAKFDLLFNVEDDGDSLEVAIEYSTDLYAADTVNLYQKALISILEGFCSDIGVEVDRVPLGSTWGQNEISSCWCGSGDAEDHAPSSQALADFLDIRGDGAAISGGDADISYAELDQKCDAVCSGLLSMSGVTDTTVGIYGEHGVDEIIAMLGVLKSGLSYVKLRKDMPDALLQKIIEDSSVQIILKSGHDSDEGLLDAFPGLSCYMIEDLYAGDISGKVEVQADTTSSAAVYYGFSDHGEAQGVRYTYDNMLEMISSYDHEMAVGMADEIFLVDIHVLSCLQNKKKYVIPSKNVDFYKDKYGSLIYHSQDVVESFSVKQTPEELLECASSMGPQDAGVDLANMPVAYSNGGEQIIPPDAPKTLIEALISASMSDNMHGILAIDERGNEKFQSYSNLFLEAKKVASGLRKHGIAPRTAAILQVESLEQHFSAFWGCVLCGVIPVTIAIAPIYEKNQTVVQKLINIWKLLDNPCLISSATNRDDIVNVIRDSESKECQVVKIDDLLNNEEIDDIYQAKPDDVIFYQLTSGSTGTPKCIQETHRAIISHILAAAEFNGYSEDDVNLSWLPMDHVVPTLTVHLKDVFMQNLSIQVKTNYILQDPLNWLRLMEKHKVNLTWAPNFAYKLITESLERDPDFSVDLSKVRFFMNAGEQVTRPVIDAFIEVVSKFGIVPSVLQPSFGMAEACTCMTFNNNYNNVSSVFRAKKSSLQETFLKETDGEDQLYTEFINLGLPVPGIEIRITDEQNNVVPERVIGRFQIRGDVITPGYYKRPEANKEAFVGDEWFNSGDIGFIHNSSLYLTGREKETIVVRGANIYCYEVEDIVNSVEGVLPTFTAACSMNDPVTGTESLAVLFVVNEESMVHQPQVDWHIINTIKIDVSKRIGLSPSYIVPIAKDDFLKTTSGKIQRSQMAINLADGKYSGIQKEIECFFSDDQTTLPVWFYKEELRPAPVDHVGGQNGAGRYLLFLKEGDAVNQLVLAQVEKLGGQAYVIYAADSYEEVSASCWRINPRNYEDYLKVFEALNLSTLDKVKVLHLWTVAEDELEEYNELSMERSQSIGLNSILNVVKSCRGLGCEVDMSVVSVGIKYGNTGKIVPVHASMLGFVKSVSQEMANIRTRYIEVDTFDNMTEKCLDTIFSDINQNKFEHKDVVYVDGKRCISGLRPVLVTKESTQKEVYGRGSTYLVLGGMGGVGKELVADLVSREAGKVYVVGRKEISQLDNASLSFLNRYSGEVTYVTGDICNIEQLQLVFEEVSPKFIDSIDMVINLAGSYEEKSAEDYDNHSLWESIRTKMVGAYTLHRLFRNSKKAKFVHFSSVNGFFGGFQVGAYSASNSFLEAFSAYQRNNGVQSYCLAYSLWKNTGMSADFSAHEASKKKGFWPIAARQGVSSTELMLGQEPSTYFIGLDESKGALQEYIVDRDRQRRSTKYAYHLPERSRLLLSKNFTCRASHTSILDSSNLLPNGKIFLRDKHSQFSDLKMFGDILVGDDPGGVNGNCQQVQGKSYAEIGMRGILREKSSVSVCSSSGTVDIGGYRLNIENVEKLLKSLWQNDEVALARHDFAGSRELVVYVVSSGPERENGKHYVLPMDNMANFIKTTVVEIDEFPLVDGAIDFDSLFRENFNKNNKLVAPQTPEQKMLAKIWKDVLSIDQVGIYDNFFEVGGSSLKAIELIQKINTQFDIELPIASLMTTPVIAEIAKTISLMSDSNYSKNLVPLRADGDKNPLFVCPPGDGNVYIYKDMIEGIDNDIPIYGFALDNKIVDETTGISDLASRFVGEIKMVQKDGPYMIGGFCNGGIIAYEIVRLLEAQGDEVGSLFLLDSSSPDIAKMELSHLPEEFRFAIFLKVFGGIQNVNIVELWEEYFQKGNSAEYSKMDMIEHIKTMTDDERLSVLFKIISSRGILDSEDGYVVLTQVYKIYNYYVESLRNFSCCDTKLNTQTVLYRCTESIYDKDDENLAEQVQYDFLKNIFNTNDDDLGWREYINDLGTQNIACNHFELMRGPYVQDVTRDIEKNFEEVSESAVVA